MTRDNISIERLITEKRLSPLMSNAKWLKLLSALVENAALIAECRVKLIWEQETMIRWLVFDEDTSYRFDYYDTAMEAMITGNPRGWYAYKEIEWLEFPRFISNKSVVQDLHAIQLQIQAIGQFQLELSDENLRLYAYRRP
ncbi:hypothetical protein LRS06_16350 [Hymenobacter sp. J193]|uniref:hypothetical protein n=1 Tax=Hymenobacter sp. J193 TaxID=2898429 RepID=UPI002151D80B|nr:hypothetical protein [Hymenobacter sp. J193]MCR5889308.1 hypothetical protein [Hymenobacter sp. J193]